MTHKETVALNNVNAGIKDITSILCEAYEKFTVIGYDALYELGHSEDMHNLSLSFQQLINEFSNTELTESDFPDCNEVAYDECSDLKQNDGEYTKEDDDANRGDNEEYHVDNI